MSESSEIEHLPDRNTAIRLRALSLVWCLQFAALSVYFAIVEWTRGALLLPLSLAAIAASAHVMVVTGRESWSPWLAAVFLGVLTLAIPTAVVQSGANSHVGVFFHVLVILSASYILGVRGAIAWTLVSLLATAITLAWVPPPEQANTSWLQALVFRCFVLLSVLFYAIVMRRAEDRWAGAPPAR